MLRTTRPIKANHFGKFVERACARGQDTHLPVRFGLAHGISGANRVLLNITHEHKHKHAHTPICHRICCFFCSFRWKEQCSCNWHKWIDVGYGKLYINRTILFDFNPVFFICSCTIEFFYSNHRAIEKLMFQRMYFSSTAWIRLLFVLLVCVYGVCTTDTKKPSTAQNCALKFHQRIRSPTYVHSFSIAWCSSNWKLTTKLPIAIELT